MIVEVSAAWTATFPGAHAGILVLRGVDNPPQHEGLEERKAALEEALRARFAGQDRAAIRVLPVLQAYQAYYKRFDKTYHVQLQLESVALKGKAIPRVAALVEAMFMAELKNLLLTAGHDLDCLELPIRLTASTGTERLVLPGGQDQGLKVGDMMMADRAGVISSVIYGVAARTLMRPETKNVLFTVYAPAGIEVAAVEQHLREIEANVRLVAPAAQVELLQVVG